MIQRFNLTPCDGLNATLEASIQEHKLNDRGRPRSCIGGWRSSQNPPLLSERPGFLELIDRVNLLLPSGIAVDYLWANVHPNGGYNAQHIHLGAPLVFVYYVQVPTPRAAFVAQGARIEPRAGDLLTFPGDLQHSVEPNESQEERISISGNCQQV